MRAEPPSSSRFHQAVGTVNILEEKARRRRSRAGRGGISHKAGRPGEMPAAQFCSEWQLLAAAATARAAIRESLLGFAGVAACRRVRRNRVSASRTIGRHDVEIIARGVRLDLCN